MVGCLHQQSLELLDVLPSLLLENPLQLLDTMLLSFLGYHLADNASEIGKGLVQ